MNLLLKLSVDIKGKGILALTFFLIYPFFDSHLTILPDITDKARSNLIAVS